MFACLHVHAPPPPQDSLLQVPPSGGTLSVSHRHTYPLNPSPLPLFVGPSSLLGASTRRGTCGVLCWICPLVPGTSADVLIWDRKGPERDKGHFKDDEVGASCIVLLIVLCWWDRGVFMQFLWLHSLWGHFGTGNHNVWVYLPQK